MDVYKKMKYGVGKYPREVVEKPEAVNRIPRYFKK
jgi:hypothetical protein